MKLRTTVKTRELDEISKKIELVRRELYNIESTDFQREAFIRKSMELDLLINEYYKIESNIKGE